MKKIENMNRVQKMTLSAMIMALYIVVLSVTSGFSFGAYQIRIATALYAMGYFFPFLVVPLGLANFISNMLFGGFGVVDMLGGCIVGMITTACVVLIRRRAGSASGSPYRSCWCPAWAWRPICPISWRCPIR